MEDKRIIELIELSKQPGSYNKVWNIVEWYSKKIRNRKFTVDEYNNFNWH